MEVVTPGSMGNIFWRLVVIKISNINSPEMQLRDIYTLEDVVSDILKVEKRVSGRESSKYSSRKDEKRYGDSRNSYGRSDNRNRTHDRSRSEPRIRTPQEDVNDYSEEIPACTDETIGYEQNESDAEYFSQEEVQIDDPYAAQDEGVVTAVNDNEGRAAANGTFARSDKRQQQGGTPPSGFNQGGYRPTAGQGMRFSDNRGGRGFSKPQYGSYAACGGLNTIASVDANCASRCMTQAKSGTPENCLRWAFKLGCLPTGLDLIGRQSAERVIDADYIYAFIRQPQSAELVIDADYIYAFICKCNYPDEDTDYGMNTTGFEKERVKINQDGDEYGWEKVAETGSMVSVHTKMEKLLPGERMGWWSSKRFDQHVRMTAIVRGAVDDVRIPILLDTEANVNIISTRLAKRIRLQQIRGHGRQLEVQGIKKGKMSTSIRVAAKITLGWNTVYEFDFWVMEHSAGSEVVLGTDFMIPAGIRLDLFDATAKLPDKVMIPLVKAQNFDDDIPEGMHVPGGPNDNLQIAAGEWADSGFSETNHH
ncbi:hypothetical protein PHMEG_00026717 [Phytophthora megakarya]|uniref:Eukaryotic/viral aspartic protease n=1 Tax=Phytophthora megakarya TaxID=4795 RepID=A0A225VA44_9STRA|nr:hypothetical protein PHMEG_00026717 [Phytophthora megakarya]